MLTGDGKGLGRRAIWAPIWLVLTLAIVFSATKLANALYVIWNDNIVPESAIVTRASPIGSVRRHFTGNYPKAALRNREEGETVVELTIGILGSVRGCKVVASSGHASLDRETCRIARGVHFNPARDWFGTKVQSRYTLPVRWELATITPAAHTP